MDFLFKTLHKSAMDVDIPFVHTDSEEAYAINLKEYGSDWYYANNPISYKFNRLGYRMKQLEEVDYDNYYAFFGCSFTVGVGLPLEETFAYKIAQRANVDYINAAVGGSSVDLVYHNFINLMSGAVKKPKMVFINWPSVYRTFYWVDDNHIESMLPNLILDGHWRRTYEDFIVMDYQVFKRFDLIRQAIHLVCDIAKIPVFEMTTYQDGSQDGGDATFNSRYPDIITDIPVSRGRIKNNDYLHLDCARDIIKHKNGWNAHPGFLHQNLIVDRFFAVMK